MAEDPSLRLPGSLGPTHRHRPHPRHHPVGTPTPAARAGRPSRRGHVARRPIRRRFVHADLLAGLTRRQREVATLFYVDDRSVSDIAYILRLNEGTVKFHLSEARDRLRQLVEHDEAPNDRRPGRRRPPPRGAPPQRSTTEAASCFATPTQDATIPFPSTHRREPPPRSSSSAEVRASSLSTRRCRGGPAGIDDAAVHERSGVVSRPDLTGHHG